MVEGLRRAQALLAEASRSDAAEGPAMIEPDLGDLVVVLLASTLAGLRDRLHDDGFERAAELVGDLVEVTDDYLEHVPA